MRKDVRRVKVLVVRKLIRNAEALRKRKGNEDQTQKCQRKATRLVDEVMILKKLKDDEISRFALLGKEIEEPDNSDIEAKLRGHVLSRLAAHPVMTSKVQRFRDSFPGWAITLPVLLKTLGANQKKKKCKNTDGVKTKNKANLNKNKKSTPYTQSSSVLSLSEYETCIEKQNILKPVIKNNVSISEIGSDSGEMTKNGLAGEKKKVKVVNERTKVEVCKFSDNSQENAGSIYPIYRQKAVKRETKVRKLPDMSKENVSSIDPIYKQKTVNRESEVRKLPDMSKENVSSIDPIYKQKTVNRESEVRKLPDMSQENASSIDSACKQKTVNREAEVCKFSDMLQENASSIDPICKQKNVNRKVEVRKFSDMLQENASSIDPICKQESLKRQSDPFFAIDGEEKSIERVRIEENRKKREIIAKRESNEPNRKQRRLQQGISQVPRNKAHRFQKTTVKNKTLPETNVTIPVEEASMHPSWEAKRRIKEQQTLSVPFQGKKITFDDD
uniref:Serum response factor-binding protein 1 n=1 Tax=Timema bartmani TaxID=61472 RepID=A0A7R9EY04_9NEOP|nr:unnamed protein product [Timema bartmani]